MTTACNALVSAGKLGLRLAVLELACCALALAQPGLPQIGTTTVNYTTAQTTVDGTAFGNGPTLTLGDINLSVVSASATEIATSSS